MDNYGCNVCGKAYSEKNIQELKAKGTSTCEACGQVIVNEKFDDKSAMDNLIANAMYNLREALTPSGINKLINVKEVTRCANRVKELAPNNYIANVVLAILDTNDREYTALKSLLAKDRQDMLSKEEQRLTLQCLSTSYIYILHSEILEFAERYLGRLESDEEKQEQQDYVTAIEKMAETSNKELFNPNFGRDVFVAYEHTDLDKALELVKFLENNKVKCWISTRNAKHGMGSQTDIDYWRTIYTAIRNCKVFIFLSSETSRDGSVTNGAMKELHHVRDNYPKKPRIQYLVGEFTTEERNNSFAGKDVSNFFDGLNYCTTLKAVAEQFATLRQYDFRADNTSGGGSKEENSGEAEYKNGKFEASAELGYPQGQFDWAKYCYNNNQNETAFKYMSACACNIRTDENLRKIAFETLAKDFRNKFIEIRDSHLSCFTLKEYDRNTEWLFLTHDVAGIENGALNWFKNLKGICVDKDNSHFKAVAGVLYFGDKQLIAYPCNQRPSGNFTVPNSVRLICDGAFESSTLKSITFSDTNTLKIRDYAFVNSKLLSDIFIPNTVLNIGKRAFWGCENLKTIYCAPSKKLRGWRKSAFVGHKVIFGANKTN